jgi:hypothetical protein
MGRVPKASNSIRRRLGATLALTLATASTFAGPEGAVAPGATDDDQWLRALTIRSEALNRLYGLGEWATPSAQPNTAESPFMSAIRRRSEALNRIYGLERTGLEGAPHEQFEIASTRRHRPPRPQR